jgi:hypothetical protein
MTLNGILKKQEPTSSSTESLLRRRLLYFEIAEPYLYSIWSIAREKIGG